MTITKMTKKVTITRPCGCSSSISISYTYVDGRLQSSPEKVKELSNGMLAV